METSSMTGWWAASSRTYAILAASRKADFTAISRDFIQPFISLCREMSVSEVVWRTGLQPQKSRSGRFPYFID